MRKIIWDVFEKGILWNIPLYGLDFIPPHHHKNSEPNQTNAKEYQYTSDESFQNESESFSSWTTWFDCIHSDTSETCSFHFLLLIIWIYRNIKMKSSWKKVRLEKGDLPNISSSHTHSTWHLHHNPLYSIHEQDNHPKAHLPNQKWRYCHPQWEGNDSQ